jgi:lipopolysaccharide export LptBFGC system permease protein LptF
MANLEYERSRKMTLVGLVIIVAIAVLIVGVCTWTVIIGLFPIYVAVVPAVVSVLAIVIYWLRQKKQWPSKDE